MIIKDPVKWTITLGFSSILLIMGIVTWISLSQIASNIDRIAELVEVSNSKTSAAHTMRDIIRMRGDVLDAMALEPDAFKREAMRQQLRELWQEYKQARDALGDLISSAREYKIFSQLQPAALAAQAYNDNAADSMLTDESEAVVRQKLQQAKNARNALLQILDNLVVMQEQSSASALADSLKHQNDTSMIIIYLSLLTFCVGVLITIQVIRHTSAKNRAIQYQASHDPLTRLVNRMEFKNRLTNSQRNCSETTQHALCYLDLDQFKIINDTCGHKAGDELLQSVSRMIKANIRHRDILGRMGGDEFALLLENCSLDKALEICEGIVASIRQFTFKWNQRQYHIGVSIGIVAVTRDTDNIETLLTQADLACYAAKDMGRNRVHVHKTKGQKVRRLQQELNWVADIRNTIEHNRFELHAQPIIPCQGRDEIAMYEVLLRLRNDQNQIISPGNYIPAAERFNLMREVDSWVAAEAIMFLHYKYQSDSHCNLRLFVNLSANSIVDQDFLEHMHRLLTQYPVPDKSLCLEITETSAIQNIELAQEFIHDLRTYGCLFALDDFGSGMSSFTYLKNLAVDFIKIDGGMVKNINNSTIDRAMVAAINEIGKVMQIETIAEFVENPEVHRLVKQLGVNYAQGFHICKPTPLKSINTHWPAHNIYHL